MVKRSVTIQSELDMNSRPVAHLVQEASQYSSRVRIEMENKQINAKSIMGMMSLNLGKGTTFTVVADGEDEEKAVNGVEEFFATH
ncbi:HPr family phosphocarrier protein [Lachnospiraceae bacterium 48-42]|jgi:Phosphotransferase System HPr (HPr) Family|nr:HPr family phosphocarrier protein [Dorea sp.]